jgi:hypothetical protein
MIDVMSLLIGVGVGLLAVIAVRVVDAIKEKKNDT